MRTHTHMHGVETINIRAGSSSVSADGNGGAAYFYSDNPEAAPTLRLVGPVTLRYQVEQGGVIHTHEMRVDAEVEVAFE